MKKMMSKYEMSITLFKIKFSQKSIIIEWKNKEKFIFTDLTTIKLQVEKYYLQAFKKRNSNFQQLSENKKK